MASLIARLIKNLPAMQETSVQLLGLLFSGLQSPSTVILEPPKIKSLPVSIVSPFICCELVEVDARILVF